MQTVSLEGVSKPNRIALLKQLGYDTDGTYVLRNGQRVLDPYVGQLVTLGNVMILPGSTILIVDNPISIAAYFEEHGDWD